MLSLKAIIVLALFWGIGKSNIPKNKYAGFGPANFIPNKHPKLNNLINVVSLTQEGYIQFLRYIVDVPVISEFTFCIWFKSTNLTNAHPLLSYSEHETTRYLRSWISPHGKEISLSILEKPIFTIAGNFREKRWYHICNSWDSSKGYWAYYLNGNLVLSNYDYKLQGLKIPRGGDMVVGQEYTDFDKGLDDGIEGDIFGFNMILSSTRTVQINHAFISPPLKNRVYEHNQHDEYTPAQRSNEEIPTVLSYFTIGPNRSPKSMFNDGRNFLQHILQFFDGERIRIKAVRDYSRNNDQFEHSVRSKISTDPEINVKRIGNNGNINDLDVVVYNKPLGLQLVELSYNCALRRGSPIDHKKVLISWTKTPVRVFGGAILKNMRPFCFKQNAG
ncbi:hypothetical protein FQA39_LY11794 [Lamprigera yunnana]|nr:hypothetical protein FQA39_LY11794 [Lamprigera yunnana]